MVIVSATAEPECFAVIGLNRAEIRQLRNGQLIEARVELAGMPTLRIGLIHAGSERAVLNMLRDQGIITDQQIAEAANAV